MADRYFPNPFQLPLEVDEADVRKTLRSSVLAGLSHIQNAIQQVNNGLSPSGTAYVGSTGVAYLFWHLSRHVAAGHIQIPRHLILLPAPTDPAKIQSSRLATPVELTQVALALCNAAIEATARHAESRCTFLEGFAGPLSLKCAILAGINRHEEANKSVAELVSYVSNTATRMPPDECEVLYGRAGLLYALLFVERMCPHADIASRYFQTLIKEIVAEGKRCGQSLAERGVAVPQPPFMHVWHRKPYLGAAHGTCGILHVLAMAHHHIKRMHNRDEIEALMKGSACTLALQLCQASGNVPPSIGAKRDELVQWCHGATGMLITLGSLHALFGSNFPHEFERLMPLSAENVWQRGLVRKGLGLCHGISGNGYAFLSAFRATQNVEYLQQARGFALYAAQVSDEVMLIPERPMSLYEGLAGAVCFWADLLSPEMSHFPGYELPPRLRTPLHRSASATNAAAAAGGAAGPPTNSVPITSSARGGHAYAAVANGGAGRAAGAAVLPRTGSANGLAMHRDRQDTAGGFGAGGGAGSRSSSAVRGSRAQSGLTRNGSNASVGGLSREGSAPGEVPALMRRQSSNGAIQTALQAAGGNGMDASGHSGQHGVLSTHSGHMEYLSGHSGQTSGASGPVGGSGGAGIGRRGGGGAAVGVAPAPPRLQPPPQQPRPVAGSRSGGGRAAAAAPGQRVDGSGGSRSGAGVVARSGSASGSGGMARLGGGSMRAQAAAALGRVAGRSDR